jgi:hypothetical protein
MVGSDHVGRQHNGTAPSTEGDPKALREDLNAEYLAIAKLVSEFDGRLMIVKGWSVALSLASLGLAFQQGHYALFVLTSATALLSGSSRRQ